MLCPTDGATLLMSERQGVEIDYCPTCRGVWLDRGELDKILERTRAEDADDEPVRPASPPPRYDPPRYERQEAGYGYGRDDPKYRKKKKKSFLEDMFDF